MVIIVPDDKIKWPSNSNASKEEKPMTEAKPSQLKGSSSIKKKNLATKFAEAFVVEDLKKVAFDIMYDTLIPGIKDVIAKVLHGSIDLTMFGNEKQRSDIYRDRERTFITDYSEASRRNRDTRSGSSRRSADLSDIEDIFFEYREDAERVLRDLKADIADYQRVSVKTCASRACLRDLEFDYPMGDYGWTDLSDAYVDRRRDGFHLVLPRPKLIR